MANLTKCRFGDIKNKIVNNQFMKKLAIFIISAAIIISATTISKESALDISGANSVTFVMDAACAEEEGLDFVWSGSDAIVNIECESVKEKYEMYNPKSVIFEFDIDKKDYIMDFLSVGQTQEQNLEGMQIKYGYTSKFSECEFIGGKKYNVMIVEKEENILVGFPIIMTGF